MLGRHRWLIRAGCLVAVCGFSIAVPHDARACSTGEDFERSLTDAIPEAEATDVPLDGVIVLDGVNLAATLSVEVTRDGEAVPGSIVSGTTWRADSPFEPETRYDVHVWTDDIGENVDTSWSFETGTETTPPPTAPEIQSIELIQIEDQKTRCVEPPDLGSCEDCGRREVVSVEYRIELRVRLSAPPVGTYDNFYRAGMRSGLDEASVLDGGTTASARWAEIDTELVLHQDLGEVGTWEGDEVCVRTNNVDPLGQSSEAVVQCVDIGDANIPPPPDTDDPDPEDPGIPEDPDSPDDPVHPDDDPTDPAATDDIDDPQGCACSASTPTAPLSALWLLLLPALRRRSS